MKRVADLSPAYKTENVPITSLQASFTDGAVSLEEINFDEAGS